jgi:hypothetical protein
MGFNTALLVLNDGLDTLQSDPSAGRKIAEMILHHSCARRGETAYVGIGNHGNVVSCLPSLHADETQIIAVGGNRMQYLGYGGNYRATPEEMLKRLADQMGYRIEPKFKAPKKWRSAKVCPNCSSRATKLLSINTGKYRCQICDHEYDPPQR